MATLRPNSDIEEIIRKASEAASTLRHEYVTLEHLCLAIMQFIPFKNIVKEQGY